MEQGEGDRVRRIEWVSHSVCSHFAGVIASMLVLLKACERSEPASPTLVAIVA